MDIAIKTEGNSEQERDLLARPTNAEHLITSITPIVTKKCEDAENVRQKTWPTYRATTQPNTRNQEQVDLPQLHYYNKTPKYTSATRSHHKSAKNLEGTRCGEIFVTNNARKWTFACTFCNKYTRDIGAFILHLKKKHLNGMISDDTASEAGFSLDDEDKIHERVCHSSGLQDQDYVDCSNYLDVNVHTAAEDLNYNKNGESFSADRRLNESSNKNSINPNEKKNLRSNHVKAPIMTTENKINCLKTNQQRQQSSSSAANDDIVSQGNSECNEVDGNSSSLMDLADCEQDSMGQDEHGWQNLKEDDDLAGSMTAADVDEDFDNQLLFVPPPMNDALFADNTNMDVASVRTVRRQIRGTAYCALCNKTFQYYSLYRNHMTKHSNETPFKCVLCKKGFKSKQAIRYHMHTHEKEKRHKCPLCHAAYYTENQVITHLLTHENSTIFPCMVCGKILRSDAERDHHLTTHTEERPFRCEYCNKLFRLRHHLSNHLKIHRQYRCDFCKSTFTSAVHQRKPYACIICAKHPHVQRQVEQAQRAPPGTPTQTGCVSAVKQDKNEVNPLKRYDNLETAKETMNCVELDEIVSEASSSNHSRSNSSSNSSSSVEDDNMGSSENEGEDRKYFTSTENSWSNGLTNLPNNEKQRLSCTYCQRTYSNVSALNYHIRNKHI